MSATSDQLSRYAMQGRLIRIGVDQAYGNWNAPTDAEGRFVYVPIPESPNTLFHAGLERRFGEVLPALHRFCADHDRDLYRDLFFPPALLARAMHLDPDFECLTYGDDGQRRGAAVASMRDGDLLVFYGGLRPIHACEQRLIYAILGVYVVQQVVPAGDVPAERWYENAHVRKAPPGKDDIVVRAKPGVSGRLERCIPIGEWRSGAYRVRHDLLEAWGGLSVKDGFIQRSAVPPALNNPRQFLQWLAAQNITLVRRNN